MGEHQQPKHSYPSMFPRGINRDLDLAWDILDLVPPGTLSTEVRALLAGAFMGSLGRVRSDAEAKMTDKLFSSVMGAMQKDVEREQQSKDRKGAGYA